MKSLFVNVPKGKFYFNKKDSTRDHLSLGDICSQYDWVYYISYEPKTDKYHIELHYYWCLHDKFFRGKLYY